MKLQHALPVLSAALLAWAQPAFAQSTTGAVNLTGSVAPRCGVATSGSGALFGQTVALGELATADGTLRAGIDSQFASAVTAVSVLCNTAAPTVSVSVSALSAQTSTGLPPAGYRHRQWDLRQRFERVRRRGRGLCGQCLRRIDRGHAIGRGNAQQRRARRGHLHRQRYRHAFTQGRFVTSCAPAASLRAASLRLAGA